MNDSRGYQVRWVDEDGSEHVRVFTEQNWNQAHDKANELRLQGHNVTVEDEA